MRVYVASLQAERGASLWHWLGLVVVGAGALLWLLPSATEAPSPQAPPPLDAAAAAPTQAVCDLSADEPQLARIAARTEMPPATEAIARAWVKTRVLGCVGQEEARQAILTALASPRLPLRWAGLLAAPWYGEEDDGLRNAIRAALGPNEPYYIRRAAADAVGRLAPDGLHALQEDLLAALDTTDLELRARLLRALDPSLLEGSSVVRAHLLHLADPDSGVREAAARALARVDWPERLEAGDAQRVLNALRTLLLDEREGVALYAAMALGRAGALLADAVPDLVEALGDRRAMVRTTAISAVSQGGDPARRALAAALAADSGSRADALTWALRLMGEDALPDLRRATEHPHARTRAFAALRTWEIDRDVDAALARLMPLLAAESGQAALEAVRGLARLGVANDEIAAAFGELAARVPTFESPLRESLDAAIVGARIALGIPPAPGAAGAPVPSEDAPE